MSNIKILIKMSKSKFQIYCKLILLSRLNVVNIRSIEDLNKQEAIRIFFLKFWNKNAIL